MSSEGKTALVTFHPVTRGKVSSADQLKALLDSLAAFEELGIVFTRANNDPAGSELNAMVEEFVSTHQQRAVVHGSLGQLLYLSTMQQVDMVVGNSSSGLIEAPALCVPTINIGDRQDGRLRATSILDVPAEQPAITSAISRALNTDWSQTKNPYGTPGVSARICEALEKALSQPLNIPPFYDFQNCQHD